MAETTAFSSSGYNNNKTNKGLPLKKVPFTEKRYFVTLAFVVSLFMLWGIAITMGDVLNRHFQKVLHISKAKSALVQFSMFGAYAVMGIPAGLFMKKFGYDAVKTGYVGHIIPRGEHLAVFTGAV